MIAKLGSVDIDFDTFTKAAKSAFARQGFIKWHAPAIQDFNGMTQIEIAAKVTAYRYPFPSDSQMKAAEDLATTFGLTVDWWECEKGWGDFVFRAPEAKYV